jgi:enoyl-CoA hydratase
MEFVLYETRDRIAAITFNRPEARNAQNKQLLDELDACWTQAAGDEDVGPAT